MSKSIHLISEESHIPPHQENASKMNTKTTSHISLQISAEKTQKKNIKNSNNDSNESSVFVDEEGKDIILLEESSKTKTFLRKSAFMFSIYFIMWSCTGIIVINAELEDPSIKNFLIYLTGFSVLLSILLKITMAVFDRKFRKFGILAFSIDLILLGIILFGLKDYLRNNSNSDIKKLMYFYEYIFLFGIISFFNVSIFVASTFLKGSDQFNGFLSFLFMTGSTAVFVFGIPFVTPDDFPMTFDSEIWNLVYFFIFICAFNIYFLCDLYLIITRMCHKLTDNDYDIVYFYIWTDWAFRFWKNLFFRKKRIFDIEDKEEEEEDDKGEVIEL